MLVNKGLTRTYILFRFLKTRNPKVLANAYKMRKVYRPGGTIVFNRYKLKDMLVKMQNNFTRK